jgi:hypothetical protein
MTPSQLADVVAFLVKLVLGAYVFLYGSGRVGPKPLTNLKHDQFILKWGKLLRIGGIAVMVFSGIQFVAAIAQKW